MKLQEHALPLPSVPWGSRPQPLPAGVRAIGKIVPEILNRYGLSLDELDERQPQPPVMPFVTRLASSHAVFESMPSSTAT